jgi:hypothetical protein
MMLTLTANLRLWTGRFNEAVTAAEQALAGSAGSATGSARCRRRPR